MNQIPEISVLMPAFNRENYITQSIQSILNQTFTNFELIILDDYSTDKTIEKINEFKDERIKLLKNLSNRGISFSRNKLFEHASGQYIALLDSDDIALPNRLYTQLKFLKSNPDILLVGTPSIPITESNEPIVSKSFLNKKYSTTSSEIAATLFFRNCFFQSSIMFSKILLGNEKYSMDFPSFGEDYEFWVRLAQKHKLANLSEPLIKYRYHLQNISHKTNQHEKSKYSGDILKLNCTHYFNYTPTINELNIHGGWQYDYIELSSNYLKKSSEWLLKVEMLNAKQKKFDRKILKNVVSRNWLERCWYSANKGNKMAAIDFIRYNPHMTLKQMPLFFYLSLKCVYKGLKSKPASM